MIGGKRDINQAKIIFLGLAESGKTSIKQVAFEGVAPKSTKLNPATVRVNRKLFEVAGSSINIHDIGGQSNYINEVFSELQERTFSNTKAVIFVVDVSDASNIMRSKYYFDLSIDYVRKYSNDAKIFVFVHKMDTVPITKREEIIESIDGIFETHNHDDVEIFGTSIFEDTLFDALQNVISYAYPRDTDKEISIKEIWQNYNLKTLAIATTQGLILYSQPVERSGLNYDKLRSDLSKVFDSTYNLDHAAFVFDNSISFMKDIGNNLVTIIGFGKERDLSIQNDQFEEIATKVSNVFKAEDILHEAKMKIKDSLVRFIQNQGLKQFEHVQLEKEISYKCDICGRILRDSMLDVGFQNEKLFERGIMISKGFGSLTVDIFPTHNCVDSVREICIHLDENLEYRKYDKSRPI